MKARRILALVAIAISILAPALYAEPAAAASSGDFVGRINGLRASKGLPALSVDGRLGSVAQSWAQQMAAAGKISHKPNLGASVSGNWTKLGENVGVGGNAGSIFSALVASPSHYRNMVDGAFTSVGVGVAVGADGRIYTAHEFAAFPGAAAPKAAAPAAKAAAPKAARAAAPKAAAPKAARAAAPKAAAVAAAPAPAPAPAAPALPAPAPRIAQAVNEFAALTVQG